MNRPIIFDGVSGATKAMLINYLKSHNCSAEIIKKLTDRQPRKYEVDKNGFVSQEVDLIFNEDINKIQQCQYQYTSKFNNHWYGIRAEDIKSIMDAGKKPAVIIRNPEIISQLKKQYPNTFCVFVFNAPMLQQDTENRLIKIQLEDLEYDIRIKRNHDEMIRYSEASHLYDKLIVNDYNQNNFNKHLAKLFNELDVLSVNPKRVFVSISFSDEGKSTFHSIKGIESSLINSNITIFKNDDEHINLEEEQITESIKNNIDKSALVICDISEMRPSVFWELGYTNATNKKVLICHKGSISQNTLRALPVVVNQNRLITYKTKEELKDKLVKQLNNLIY